MAKSSKKKAPATGGARKIVPLAVMEKQAIMNALKVTKDDKLKAARLLGIGKTTLYRKLKEYGVTDEDL
jgi:DNA-binding NtrC family response regulator